MKRQLLLVLSVVFCGVGCYAQQRPIQSLYMFDPLLINPAYAGTQVQLSATAIYRNQWVNLEGAPKTFTASMHSGFLKSKMGLGIILGNDEIGIHHDASFYGVYSYKVMLQRDVSLNMGIQGGFNYLVSNYDQLTLKNPGDPNLAGAVSKFNPNIGAGFYLRTPKFYAGISSPQLIENKVVDLSVATSAKQRRYYYATAGFSKSLSNNVKFLPSALLRFQDNAPISLDINALFVFYQTISLGMSYRLNEGVVALFELQLDDHFHVGYAYDYTLSALNQVSNGSHELMINYRLKIAKIHKGLECPTYW